MTKKITLTISDSAFQKALELSEKQGLTPSQLFERHVLQTEPSSDLELDPQLKAIILPPHPDTQNADLQEYREAIIRKLS